MRLTPTDLERAVSWMEARWGHQKKWATAHVDLFEDFANFTPGALMETLTLWYRAGNKFAPSPSELRSEVAKTQRLRTERGDDVIADECVNHAWAAPDPWDTDRHLVCAVCGEVGRVWKCHRHTTRGGRCIYCWAPADQIPTESAPEPDPEPEREPVAADLFGDDEAPF